MENEVIIKSISSSSDTMQFMVVKNDTEVTDNDILTENNDGSHGLCDNKTEARTVHQNVSSDHASGQTQEIFRCDVCDVEFNTMGDLRSHANTLHLNAPSTKPLPKSVPITKKKPRRLKKKKESWLSRLAEIRETLPPQQDSEKSSDEGRMWECELCRNSFNRKDHLAKHIAFVHERIRPYACDRCGHRFSQKHHVAQHIQSKHENDESRQKPLACETCGKRFARKEHVENHVKLVHEKRKPFECGVCKKKFSQKHHFLSHVSNMHGVKNDPGLIPTERELKLTMKTIEKKDHVSEGEHKLSNSFRTKMKPKPQNPNSVEKRCSLESEEASLENEENGMSEDVQKLDTCSDTEEKEEVETESISIMKYNPHVCPFCDKSFKQLPQLGAHIMAIHEPPTDPAINMKNKKK